MNMITPPWMPITAPLTCGSLCRSPEHYRQVVAQFAVATSPRYAPRDGMTFCNDFSWDVTRAMACEVPYWWLREELSINRMVTWLGQHGPAHGWREVIDAEAELQAAAGRPTLVTYRNPRGHGHVAVVLPSDAGLRIAQAGARCFFDEPLASGFGRLLVQFWSHS